MADPIPEAEESVVERWLSLQATPDRLRLMAIVVVALVLAAGAIAWRMTDQLAVDTAEVSQRTGEVLIATQQVSASFAEADAAAVSVHLAGAEGNREQRRLFELAIDRATSSLERVARLVGDDEVSHTALQDIAANTTEYAGLVEAARLGSIEDLPSADPTLTLASAINRNAISPDVDTIATRAAARFADQTSAGTYAIAIALLAAAALVVLLAMIRLWRQFRRLINVPLALAMAVLLVLVGASVQGLVSQQRAFSDAETEALDAIQISDEIQQAAYRHRALGTSSVLENEPADTELSRLEGELEAANGLLARAANAAGSDRERATAAEIEARWERYVDDSLEIQAALRRNDLAAAEAITQGAANASFNGFNTAVEAALLDNRAQFLGQLQAASDSLRYLRGLILVGTLAAAVLAWWGFAQRIGEYR